MPSPTQTPALADATDATTAQVVSEVLLMDAQLPQVPPLVLACVAEQCSALAEQALRELEGRPNAANLGRARVLMRALARNGLQAQRCARVLGGDYLPVREYIEVERDDNLRMLMRELLHDAGVHVEVFGSPRQAEDLSRHFLAESVVNGYPPDDPDVLALISVLRQRNPAVRMIQLTDEDYLYIGADGATEAARAGRASVRQALVQAVLLSVGVFAPPG